MVGTVTLLMYIHSAGTGFKMADTYVHFTFFSYLIYKKRLLVGMSDWMGVVGGRAIHVSKTNQIEASMNNQSNCPLQLLQRQQVCPDTSWLQLNTTSATWRKPSSFGGVSRGINKHIFFLEKTCFRMRISTESTVEIPTEITGNVTLNRSEPALGRFGKVVLPKVSVWGYWQ